MPSLVKQSKAYAQESDFQKDVVCHLEVALPRRTGVLWFAIPNGELRDPAIGAKLKAMGVKAGVPDLQFVWQGRCYFIELKLPGRGASPEQKKVMAALGEAGAPWTICKTMLEVYMALERWQFPLQARSW